MIVFLQQFLLRQQIQGVLIEDPHLTEEHTHQFRWLNSLMSGWSDEPNVQRNWCCDFVLELLDSY